jgi:prophage antirepressor-like protein
MALQQKKSNGNEIFISEGDTYRLICRSTTEVAAPVPEAIEFEKWVFDELLPTLCRTGTYTINDENCCALMKSFVSKLNQ